MSVCFYLAPFSHVGTGINWAETWNQPGALGPIILSAFLPSCLSNKIPVATNSAAGIQMHLSLKTEYNIIQLITTSLQHVLLF